MEKILTEQTTKTSVHTTEVEKENVGTNVEEVSLGKFKDINALLSAYNSLESEFTKRCQKIKELEEKIKTVDKENAPTKNVDKVVTPTETNLDKGEGQVTKSITNEEKEEILKGYLKEIMSLKSKAIVMAEEGTGTKSPLHVPTTVEQAGRLAKAFLDTKNN